jgi:hypothetical protein
MDYKEGNSYKDSVLGLLNKLYALHKAQGIEKNNKDEEIKKIVSMVYGILRTAKFIRGEEVIDE